MAHLPLDLPAAGDAGRGGQSSILSFIFSWNELLFAYILAPKAAKTAPAMAVTFMEGYDVPYGKIMATSTLIVIPVLIFALLASKHLVRGLTMGAVKYRAVHGARAEAAADRHRGTVSWRRSPGPTMSRA